MPKRCAVYGAPFARQYPTHVCGIPRPAGQQLVKDQILRYAMGDGIASYRRSVACRSNGEKVKAKYRLAGESQLAVHQYRLAPITMNEMLALSNVFASVANKV